MLNPKMELLIKKNLNIFYGFYCTAAILFTAAIFKGVSEDMILSYDLNIFSLFFIWDLTIIADFCFERFHSSCIVEVFTTTGKE